MPAYLKTGNCVERMTTVFRRLMNEKKECLIGPGVFDGISAHVANATGFDFLYLAGSGSSGSYIGEPDLSVITQTEMTSLARTVVHCSNVPVIADADTGFGGPLNIRRTIQQFEAVGVAGIHIEDQTYPKRCGQLEGKHVVELDEFLERVAAAVESRSDKDFVIIARTDARQAKINGKEGGIEECIKRLKAAFDVGADMGFVESPMSREECEHLVKSLAPRPVLINVIPHGLTPNLTTKDCTDIGFRAAIYPCTGFIPAMIAMRRSYGMLKETGSDWHACDGLGIKDFFMQMGLQEEFDFDKRMVDIAKGEVEGGKFKAERSAAGGKKEE